MTVPPSLSWLMPLREGQPVACPYPCSLCGGRVTVVSCAGSSDWQWPSRDQSATLDIVLHCSSGHTLAAVATCENGCWEWVE